MPNSTHGSVAGGQSRGGQSYRPPSIATTATIASVKSEKYAEYQRRKQHQELNKRNIGPGHRQFRYGIIFAIFGMIVFAAGAILLILQLTQKHVFIAYGDEMGFIGPSLLVLGLVILGIAAYFFVRAKRRSNQARQHFAFRPAGTQGVSVVNMQMQPDTAGFRSGTGHRTPTGSYTTNGSLSEYIPAETPTSTLTRNSANPQTYAPNSNRPVSAISYGRRPPSVSGSALSLSKEQPPPYAAPGYDPGPAILPINRDPLDSASQSSAPSMHSGAVSTNPAGKPGPGGSRRRYKRNEPMVAVTQEYPAHNGYPAQQSSPIKTHSTETEL